ncbi:hypothetical protein AM588_10000940 [Phytophthora nicotianae]|uniref:PiggyBac transposable element-derived protein domain-containing protein n=1 Tax=Phytophthora nicotianae TaxID=4792 RepID=A0A0W8CMN6_PHYNI|nr:hypothetical protein AM588_10000940 [Phytophthora nicotianae]
MPLKPDKFAIRFYAVVGWRSLYIHALWDNGSGNTTATTPAERYTRLFPRLRQPLYNVLNQGEVHVDPKTPSALWLAMIAHQTLLLPAENGRRLLVSDNFYTRHTLAKAVLAITDGETRMLGTVRQDWIGSLNKDAVADSIARVKTKPRGSWELVAAVDSCLASKKDKAAHARKQKKVPAHLRTPYSPPVEFSPRAGFIVFLDKQPVVFYTNDLASTPTARVLDGTNSEAISCCHGLYPIQRWTTNRVLHREVLLVPAVVAAYNVAMNGVDRVDQLRSTNPTRRKEQRISMSIFTWLLDLSLINAFALMHHIQANAKAPRTLREFKRRVCESLTNAQRGKARSSSSKRRRSEPTPQHDTINSGLHVLTPNSSDHSSGKLVCHLCSMRGTKTSKSRFGCTGCLVGYHVGCFAVAHYKDAFHTTTPSVAAALQVIQDAENGNPASQTRRRHNNTITPLEKLELQN